MQHQILAPVHRTAKGLTYEKFIGAARDELRGMTAESKKKAKAANIDFLKGLADPKYRPSYEDDLAKAIAPANVHVDTLLATMSVMYKNDEYIGEELMAPIPVSKRSDKYAIYPKRERFAFPEDEMTGTRSSPNELDATRTTDNYSVKDYGYMNFLDLETVQNQDSVLDEMVDVVEAVNEGIAFRRESRILTIVGTSGNYGGNTGARTAAWTAGNSGGSIIADLLAAKSAIWRGATPTELVGFCTLTVWNNNIANNAAIRELFKYTDSGLSSADQVARFFGLDRLLVTSARTDTANIGQTASYSRMLATEIFGILSVAKRPSRKSLHFGSTFRMNGDPFTSEWTDPKVGKRGGIYAKVVVSEDHKVVAGDAGYLITGVGT